MVASLITSLVYMCANSFFVKTILSFYSKMWGKCDSGLPEQTMGKISLRYHIQVAAFLFNDPCIGWALMQSPFTYPLCGWREIHYISFLIPLTIKVWLSFFGPVDIHFGSIHQDIFSIISFFFERILGDQKSNNLKSYNSILGWWSLQAVRMKYCILNLSKSLI